MLKRLAILGLLLVVAPLVPGQPNKATDQKQEPAKQDHPTVLSLAANGQNEQTNSQANRPKSSSDLQAANTPFQRPEVWWADSNWWLVIVAALTGGVIAWQSTLMRRQISTFIAKERAHLTLEIEPYEPIGAVQTSRVTLVVTNHGGTNAFVSKARSTVCINRTDWDMENLALDYGAQTKIPNVIPPGSLEFKESILPEDEWNGRDIVTIHNLLREEENSIFAVGFIEFEDIFGNGWRYSYSRCWGGLYSGNKWCFTDEWMNWPTYPNGEEKINKPSKLQKRWKRLLRHFQTSIPFDKPPQKPN